MNTLTLFFSLILLSTASFAKNNHSHHGKHEHGAIKLEIAVDENIIEIDLDGPSESFIGFEYRPVTKQEKDKYQDAESLWSNELLTKLFILDKKLECQSSEASFKQVIEKDSTAEHTKNAKKESGIHSDIEAKAKIICAKNLKGQTLSISLKKYYSRMNKLSIDIIGSEVKSIEAKTTEEIKL